MGRNIREIALVKATITADRALTDSVVFRRNGTATRRTEGSEHVNSQGSAATETGKISTDRFERLAKTVEENDFFAATEHEGHAGSMRMSLTVSTDDGSKNVQNVDENDRQIQNIIAALEKEASQVEWTLTSNN